MSYSKRQLWERFQKHLYHFPEVNLTLDISRMNFPDHFFSAFRNRIGAAFENMAKLEQGAIANEDEKRMVGHYWLRNPALAPTPEISQKIQDTLAGIKDFAAKVHSGEIRGAAGPFRNVLLVGIGGSALGPQFVSNALGIPNKDKLRIYFSDNTDPDGMDRTFQQISDEFGYTLTIIISKSGGTKETRNGMFEAAAAYKQAAVDFARHTVVITGEGSELDKYAVENQWLARFPMWEWVGGRTSELSAVGLLPAALQGFDIDSMLKGAEVCDEITRRAEMEKNPAALMAAMWFHAGEGKGSKNLIILPYKDRLELFSKYLQQLIMESLGKEQDRDKQVIHQGLTVFGNKGSTDQHSYIQQLRDGLDNFFVTFVEVLKDRNQPSLLVDRTATTGDYLEGFFLGTRQALYENGRESITITIKEVNAYSVGVLIALFERVVGLYAELINVNAYHQPGVEAGKKAAASVLSIQERVLIALGRGERHALSVDEISARTGLIDEPEIIFKICEHLSANRDRGVGKVIGSRLTDNRYFLAGDDC